MDRDASLINTEVTTVEWRVRRMRRILRTSIIQIAVIRTHTDDANVIEQEQQCRIPYNSRRAITVPKEDD